ncbi:MAG: hypothetical protein A3F31_01370 [Candidatus Levybacteria bacterium RIFCSPHIGHO2_12_FULL_38_12]|nr:MAG: hypothetical protein A3F31_01370 [Candidatus Levybacteria bacterium RIFCSPHIGHO2_12_FULL_38_12]
MENINWSDVIPPILAQLILIGTTVSWVPVILLASFLFFIGLITLKYFQFKKSLQGSYVLLEIKPPSISLQTAFTTKQLFTILHSLDTKPTLLDRLLRNKKRISYEIASSRSEGIRYLIYTPKEDVSILRKNLLSYLPGIEIQQKLPNSTKFLLELQEGQLFSVEDLWDGFSKHSSQPIATNPAYGSVYLLGLSLLKRLEVGGYSKVEALSEWLDFMVKSENPKAIINKFSERLGLSQDVLWSKLELQCEGQEILRSESLNF